MLIIPVNGIPKVMEGGKVRCASRSWCVFVVHGTAHTAKGWFDSVLAQGTFIMGVYFYDFQLCHLNMV